MNSRRSYLFAALAVIAIIAFIAIAVVGITSNPNGTSTQSVQYTNPTTGQTVVDNPPETNGQVEGVISPPVVSINGYSDAYKYFTDDQAYNLQKQLTDFLMARSGLNTVVASIQNGQITQVDDQTIQFTIVVARPQQTYMITAKVSNQYQTIPNVTFKQLE